MINRIHRFHGRNSLRFVYQKGRTVRGSYCSLKYVYNPRRKSYRLAVVVSRKVHKSAVVRNRIRRRIYEAVRLRQDDIKDTYDMVFIVFSEQLATMPAPELQKRIYDKLYDAGIFADKTPTPGHQTEKDRGHANLMV